MMFHHRAVAAVAAGIAMMASTLITVVVLAGSAYAAGPSESEQRTACLGDALRLCAQFIPDRGRIRACLGEAHAELSPSCRVVYDASVRAEALAAPGH